MMQKNKFVLSFVTQNRYKFNEAQIALSEFPNIILEQLDEDKGEYKDESDVDPVKKIAINSAVTKAKKYNKIVVAEDSGLFFEAYNDYNGYPGMNTKWEFKSLGYKGIMKLLVDEPRSAYFRTVLAMSNPNGKYVVFEGIVKGRIAEKVYGMDIDCMDYDRIFIPEGSAVPFALMMNEKRVISHRYKAFHSLGKFIEDGGRI